ncbi:DUF7344 domain-containing protein [Halopiger thermotolerans]
MCGDDTPANETTDSVDSRRRGDDLTVDVPINIGDLFRILANERTRYLLYLLTARGGTVHRKEIERYFDSEDVGIELRHNQLPRLADHGIIDYHREAGSVTLTPIGDELKPVIERVQGWENDEVDEFLRQAKRDNIP